MAVSNAAHLDQLELVRRQIDARLAELIPETAPDDRLNRSMRHSLLTPGKRLRPMMTVLAADAIGASGEAALDPACAIEMVHAASLMVDDLPFMDDADHRRGRRSSHSRFGVEIAVLAAVSLLNRAPQVIARSSGLDAALRLRLIELLSRATGDVSGLVAGQIRDLEAVAESTSLADLERIVRDKTASLFSCAAESGALIASGDAETVAAMCRFAGAYGMAFQILDDLDDAHEAAAAPHADGGERRKATFASVMPPEEARDLALDRAADAKACLAEIGLAESPLAALVDLTLVERTG